MSALNEYVMLEILRAGNLRKHLDRLQRKIMAARNACTRQLSEAGIRFEHLGEGGIFLWGSVPDGVDVDLLVQDACRNKILLMRGAAFSANSLPDQHIRFNVAFCQHPRLSGYLRERLDAVAGARASLREMSISQG
jgi:DNA-binding transcriptional MocR family regulator